MTACQTLPIDEVYELAKTAVRTVHQSMAPEEFASPERQGGMLCVAIEKDGQTTIYDPRQLGLIPEVKVAKRKRLAKEKVLRLIGHPSHASSRESADPEHDQHPGAARFRSGNVHYVFGFSGFTSDDDERVCDELAKLMGGLEPGPRLW